MTPERAIEIIASHGADAARWPADERAAVLALSGTPDVAAALVDARRIDALLGDWLADMPATMPDLDAIVRRPQLPMASRRWWPGAVAAGVVAVLATASAWLIDPGQRAASAPDIAAVSAPSAAATEGEEAFAYVFTPTASEEDLI